jgi:galactokinase
MKDQLLKEFRSRFQKDPDHLFFCPGRVNLIGEHIDYNGGKVMPCAISLGTYLAVSKNTTNEFRLQSLDFPETAAIPVKDHFKKSGTSWFNYPIGVFNLLAEKGHNLTGLDMVFSGNLPIGSGLSSSASIEILTIFMANEMFGLNISRKDMAILCKKVENDFIGVNSGIMDQFAVAMGKKDHAILLDCETIEHTYLPLQLGKYTLAIINTNKTRKLEESKYNERFDECQRALAAIQTQVSIQNLCDLSTADFILHKHLVNDPVLEKRALHVVAENDRVHQAANALHANDLSLFGKLMYASHYSLQELYEVSGEELDTIVAFCKSYNECPGARMTGAGFGGCAIALVDKKCFEDFSRKLIDFYTAKIGYAPGIFSSDVGDGVMELKD